MSAASITDNQLFSLLEGAWTGEGRGEYPTIASFDYREMLTFTRRDDLTLAYEQRTQKRFDGQTDWLVSHWENGFFRILESGELELVNAQSGGRGEVLIGVTETRASMTRIRFTSKVLMNDPRMVCSARTFELEGDTLRYEMDMQTTQVDRLAPHLKIALQRIK